MKKQMILTITLLSAMLMPALRTAYAATQSFNGVISDSMCKKQHSMMPGKSDAQCVEECVKAGASYVLVVGDKVYTLAAKPGVISPHAGKHVQVQGELVNNTITVSAIR
jgi:hypothetical protein